VGLEHFQRFFSSAFAPQVISNTILLSLYAMLAGFPIPIMLALMLNQFRHKRYRKVIQTVTYAPYFISVVVMSGVIILFLSPSLGVINNVIRMLGGDTVNFLGQKELWRHIYVWSGVWQGMGWNSVIYFAALSGVSPEYHEAAVIDGASKAQRIWYIDLPFLIPTAVILFILNAGSLMNIGFEKAYALQNPMNLEVSQIISTYVYQMGMINNDISFSAAVGLFNSLVNAVLLVLVNAISRRVSEHSLW
jgi:putative aldouronate transport system permease protein